MLIMFTHLSHLNLNICDYQPLLLLSENSEKHYLAFLNIKISLVYSLPINYGSQLLILCLQIRKM